MIIPNFRSRDEAEAEVNAAKYTPVVTRGVELYKPEKFGREFEEYQKGGRGYLLSNTPENVTSVKLNILIELEQY